MACSSRHALVRPVAIAVTVIESRLFHDTCPRDDTSYAAMMDWFRFPCRYQNHLTFRRTAVPRTRCP
jgi:hypothetical protein